MKVSDMHLRFMNKAAQYLHIQIQHGAMSGIKGRIEDIRLDLHHDAALGEDITVTPDLFPETLPQEFKLHLSATGLSSETRRKPAAEPKGPCRTRVRARSKNAAWKFPATRHSLG